VFFPWGAKHSTFILPVESRTATSALHLCTPNETPAGLVVFAIVLDRRYSKRWQREDNPYLATFMAAISDHLRELSARAPRGVDIYAQTEKKNIRRLLHALQFEPTKRMSGDGFPFYFVSSAKLFEGYPAPAAISAMG
jgi:hypothetical protein